MNNSTMSQEHAEALAVSGLARLAADDDLMGRFSALSGILPNDIREAAGQPGFLVGVIDFYLAHEPDLLAWSQDANFPPEQAMAARYALDPQDMSGFE